MRKSATLMELMIAVVLLALIVLAAGSFEVASRYFLRSTETKVDALNELTFVLEHLHKNILLGIGDNADPANVGIVLAPVGCTGTDCVLSIRQDVDVQTPSDYSDDKIVQYRFDSDNNKIEFDNGTGSWKELTDNFIDLGAYGGSAFGIQITSSGGVQIDHLATVYDAVKYKNNEDRDPRTNAVVTTEDTQGSATIFFYPLSHSWR